MVRPEPQRLTFLFVLLVILNVGFWIYSNTLVSSFHFDDDVYITNVPAIRHLTDFPAIAKYYNTRFVVGLTFALNYCWGGFREMGYHLVNLGIHLINALLVYAVVLRLIAAPFFQQQPVARPQKFAFFSALIFLVHPLQTEAVTYICQRATIVGALFYLTSIYFYLRARVTKRLVYFIFSLAATFLGTLTKENVFILPLVILFVEVFFFQPDNEKLRIKVLRLLPYFLMVTVLPFLLWLGAQHAAVGFREQMGSYFSFRRLWIIVNILPTVARLLFFPVHQNLDYDFFDQGFGLMRAGVSLFLVVVVAVSAVRAYPSKRIISFCAVWFFITPIIEFSTVNFVSRDILFEHWLYLPMFGFSVFVAWIFCVWLQDRRWSEPLLVVIIIALGLTTYARNRIWQTPVSLWHDVIEKSPRKPRGYDNLAAAYLAQKNYGKAEEYIWKVFSLGPSAANWKTHNNLGLVYLETGRYEQAVDQFNIALAEYPEAAQIACNRGVAFLRQGQLDKAEATFQEVLQHDPGLVTAWLNRGAIAMTQKDFIRAVRFYEEALRQDPREVKASLALAELSLSLGDNERALSYAKQVLAESRDPDQLTRLGSIFAAQNSRNMARDLLEAAIRQDPQWVDAHLELGKVYGNAGYFDAAIVIWEKGRMTAPADPRFDGLIREAQMLKKK